MDGEIDDARMMPHRPLSRHDDAAFAFALAAVKYALGELAYRPLCLRPIRGDTWRDLATAILNQAAIDAGSQAQAVIDAYDIAQRGATA